MDADETGCSPHAGAGQRGGDGAVAAGAEPSEFTPQGIANLLWALAKLVEREVLTPEQASEAVTALLPQVQNHQAEFKPQEIANLLWALAKLVERR